VPPRRNGKSASHVAKAHLNVSLSPRQEQILRCVHMDSTNRMIARALGISEGTVKVHLASIFPQLGAPNRAAAVAIYNGLLANQLQVLRTRRDSAPKPAYGAPGPVPLRSRADPTYRYPLRTDDTAAPLLIAAEPTVPYGGAVPPARATPSEADANGEEPEAPPASAHDLPSNE
jgi:DNA-binding CsgD family transcriptional regulator